MQAHFLEDHHFEGIEKQYGIIIAKRFECYICNKKSQCASSLMPFGNKLFISVL